MTSELKNFGINIYTAPNGLVRRDVVHGNTRLVKELFAHAQTVCRNQISEQYIADVLNPDKKSFSKGYVYSIDDEILGFVVWTIQYLDKLKKPRIYKTKDYNPPIPSKVLFIDLICAKGTGTTLGYKMIDDIENFCINNAIPCINLEPSDDDLIPYYEKIGFSRLSLYNSQMTKPIIQLIQNTSTNYKISKTRKLKYQTRKQLSERDKAVLEKYLIDIPKISENIKNIENIMLLNTQ